MIKDLQFKMKGKAFSSQTIAELLKNQQGKTSQLRNATH